MRLKLTNSTHDVTSKVTVVLPIVKKNCQLLIFFLIIRFSDYQVLIFWYTIITNLTTIRIKLN
jgi:hypothetical protein